MSHSKNMFLSQASSAGMTLMEIILSIALLSIMVGGTLWLLFLQNATYAQTVARAEAMAKLSSAYQVMYKEIRPLSRKELVGKVSLTSIATDSTPGAPSIFEFIPGESRVTWKAQPFLNGVLASFTPLDEKMDEKPADPIATPTLIRIELESTEANDCSLKFLVAPRSN